MHGISPKGSPEATSIPPSALPHPWTSLSDAHPRAYGTSPSAPIPRLTLLGSNAGCSHPPFPGSCGKALPASRRLLPATPTKLPLRPSDTPDTSSGFCVPPEVTSFQTLQRGKRHAARFGVRICSSGRGVVLSPRPLWSCPKEHGSPLCTFRTPPTKCGLCPPDGVVGGTAAIPEWKEPGAAI